MMHVSGIATGAAASGVAARARPARVVDHSSRRDAVVVAVVSPSSSSSRRTRVSAPRASLSSSLSSLSSPSRVLADASSRVRRVRRVVAAASSSTFTDEKPARGATPPRDAAPSSPRDGDGDGSDGDVSQLERATADAPVTPTSTPATPSNSSSPPPPRRNHGALSRFALKCKLYAIMFLGFLVKFASGMLRNRWFVATFTVFVGASAALGVKAVAARRAGASRANTPRAVLYSHFVKDLSAKKVTAVRFEEGTGRILYELKHGATSSAPAKAPAGSSTTAGSSSAASKAKAAALSKLPKMASKRVSATKTSDAATPSNSATEAAKPPRGVILQTKRIPDERLMTRLEASGVEFGSIAAPPSSYISKGALTAMALWIPLIPLYFMFRNATNKQGGGGTGKKARTGGTQETPVTFADVAGVDAAKTELIELVQMLRSAEKYKGVKNRLPTGCLLVGPPGTGKTLLAKAVAGEAGVPFFSVAASEFVELFVGRGAARVRELFAEARKASPSVIFIDELDAIGARRGAGLNEERDQTLNQMLVEMDGFNKPGGVLVLAATNRAEALDPALLRPGRLTRRVFVGPPDYAGRAQILRVHLRGVETREGETATCEAVARITGGFTGAELANVVNEGVLLAAREGREVVAVDDLFQGAERTKMGVGVGQGASSVLSGLRKLMSSRNDGGGWGGGGNGGNGGTNGPEGISEDNKRQGVGLSMPPT